MKSTLVTSAILLVVWSVSLTIQVGVVILGRGDVWTGAFIVINALFLIWNFVQIVTWRPKADRG